MASLYLIPVTLGQTAIDRILPTTLTSSIPSATSSWRKSELPAVF